MKRRLIALGIVWFVISVTIATRAFPALVRACVVCDGLDDDDPEWQLALARDDRSKKYFVEMAVSNLHFTRFTSHFGCGQELRHSAPLPTLPATRASPPHAYSPRRHVGDDDSLEPH